MALAVKTNINGDRLGSHLTKPTVSLLPPSRNDIHSTRLLEPISNYHKATFQKWRKYNISENMSSKNLTRATIKGRVRFREGLAFIRMIFTSFTIWGFHGGDYEEFHLLGCDAMWLLQESTLRKNVSPPSSE
jgi:hypothetical protein